MKASDIMTRAVITITPDHSIRHAARLMADRRINGLPVTNGEGRLVGILTDGDLLRRVELGTSLPSAAAEWADRAASDKAGFVKTHSWQAGDVMSREVVTIDEDTPLGEIAATLGEHNIKRVPVMRGQRLVGIVSRTDLVRCIADAPVEETVRGKDAIKRSVQARLRERANLLSGFPEVAVLEGVVHLSGTVQTQLEREVLRVIVESVRGVAGVEDHLEVVPQPSRRSAAAFPAHL